MWKLVVACALLRLASALPLERIGEGKRGPSLIEDFMVRNKFFPMAAAAYSDEPEECVKVTFENATVQKKVKRLCGDGYREPENCFGFTALLHSERAILLSFRGTHGLVQLIYELNRTLLKARLNATAGGQVGAYFYSVYESVMEHGLEKSLKTLAREHPDYEIWITGHSLGGALASIAAVEMIARGVFESNRIKLITFGQPRTGDTEFAAAHDKLLTHSYRVVHAADIVPHLPYENFQGYYHHRNELWYSNGMRDGETFVECNAGEDLKCSDGAYWKLSVLDHIFYYQVDVQHHGVVGCVRSKSVMSQEQIELILEREYGDKMDELMVDRKQLQQK